MNTKAIVTKSMESSFRLMRKDIEELPEEAFAKCYGGKARTVADIVYEVILVNEREVQTTRNEKLADWPEGWIKAPENVQTKEQVLAAFNKAAAEVLAAANSFTSEQLEEPLQTEDGETTRFERFRFMALHTWYHSGQLNFVQTLIGDDEFHWAKP
jgi:uncharacterized damage-inducible protein DinB